MGLRPKVNAADLEVIAARAAVKAAVAAETALEAHLAKVRAEATAHAGRLGDQLRSVLERLESLAARDAELARLRVRVAALERQLAAARAGDTQTSPVADPGGTPATDGPVIKPARTSRAKTAAAKPGTGA